MEALKPLGQKDKRKYRRARLGELEASHSKVWAALRELSPATVHELARVSGLTDIKVGFYLSFLERAGYVWLQVHSRPRLYWLVNDTGWEAPQRLRKGRAVFDPNTNETYEVRELLERWPGEPAPVGTAEFDLWHAMRILRNFTVGELAAVTGQDTSVVQERVNNLMCFDFLRKTEPSLGKTSYLLPKYRVDYGEKPPAINMQLGKLYIYKTKETISIQG